MSQLELGVQKASELGVDHQHWNEVGKGSHHEDITDRPVLASLFAAINAGRIQHLWVYDQSRLFLDDQAASGFLSECKKQGVKLYTKDGWFDLSSPQDMLLKQVPGALAEFDNTTRAERARLGRLHRVRSGHWHGGPPPYGYQLNHRKLDIEPTESKWVRRMFELSASGASPAQIKRELDANGVTARRGGLWTIASVVAMLKNPHYAGHYTYKGAKSEQEIHVLCPSIVDVTTWEAVQVLLREHEHRHRQKNVTKKHFYLLRDLMYCAHCGHPISGKKNQGTGQALYYCPNKERAWVGNGGKSDAPWPRGTGCGFDRSMNIDRADELVLKHVQDLHAQSSLLKEEVKRRALKEQDLFCVADKGAKNTVEAKVRRLQKDLTSISETIGNVEASRLLKRMDDISYATATQRLNEEQQRLQAALAEVKLQLRAETVRKKWIDWLDAFGEAIKNISNCNDEQRKRYVEGIVERIDVRWLPEQREHEMTMHFRLPIVGDGIQWVDEKRTTRGYTMVDGQRTATVKLSQKMDEAG